MPKHSRVFGYARVSSTEQALGTSLRDQQTAITAYAKTKGLTVTKFYVEAESSVAERFERREQIQALMLEVRAGDLVLCDKIDRWSRDPEFTYASVARQIIRERKASFYAVGDACDPSTPEGDTMLNFRIMFAREEHKRIKQRMVGTRRLLRDQGYYVEGLPPLGYVRPHPRGYKGVEKNILAIDPAGAKLVRDAFRLSAAGRSLSQIAEALGISRDKVHDVTKNRLYIGEIENTTGEWIRGKHDPIIDADVFERAQQSASRRKLGAGRTKEDGRTGTWILRDVATCGLCGARMGAAYAGPPGGPPRRFYYKCVRKCTTAYVNVAVVEPVAAQLVVDRLETLRNEVAAGDVPKRPVKAAIDFDARRVKIQKRRDRFYEAFADEGMSKDELRSAIAKLDSDRLKLDAEEQRATKPSPLYDETVRRDTLRNIVTLRKAWSLATPQMRRQIVNTLAVTVALVAGCAPLPTWKNKEELAKNTT